jgi:hypothetical protein
MNDQLFVNGGGATPNELTQKKVPHPVTRSSLFLSYFIPTYLRPTYITACVIHHKKIIHLDFHRQIADFCGYALLKLIESF